MLLVEDEPDQARLIRDMLRQVQDITYEIWHADSLHDAISALREKEYDLLLIDLTLPDSRSLTTFVRLRIAAPEVPIIVLTGINDDELARTAVRRGAQDFLVKGHVDKHLLDCSIRYALERHRLFRRTEVVREKLIEAERDRVVQETAGGTAHLINQPLTVVTVVADHLLHTIDPGDPDYDLIESLFDASQRIDKIVREMGQAKHYAVRPYTDLMNILDLEAAAHKPT
jgi:DNA-binding NtrC family response regulator